METPANVAGAIVVIGFAESLSAPEVMWSLADGGFKVVAFTRKGGSPALRSSRFVSLFEITAPESSASAALSELEEHLASLRRTHADTLTALMPLDDASVWLCGRIPARPGLIHLGVNGEAIRLGLDKWLQTECARQAGFSVPPTRLINSAGEVIDKPVDFPVVFKPVMAALERDGRLDRGRAWVCADEEELRRAVDAWAGREPMLLQQFVAGIGIGLFGLATERGVIGWSAHRRVRMMNPQGSGSSACISEEVDQSLRAVAERFVGNSCWRGLFMIELLREDSGKVWFMEFNGRAWGSMALARRVGFEYPAWAAKLALSAKAEIPVPKSVREPVLCRHLGRELLHLLFVARGSKSKIKTGWPSLWTALRDVCSFSKNQSWYNWRPDDRKVFINDTVATVASQIFKRKRPS